MIKTLKNVLKADKESFKVPNSVQQTIPIKRMWPDGTFQVGNKFSRTFRFTDINYSVASRDAKLAMFLQYCDLLNALEIGSTTKITINNRRMTKGSFAQNLLKHKDDGLDVYRDEYNSMIIDAAIRGNGIIQDKYITVSVIKNTHEEAKTFFNRVYAELSSRFAAMSSRLSELDVPERMRIFHDFFRMGEEENYYFELQDLMRRGHSFQDSICPDSMTIKNDYIKLGKKYARVLYIREFPSYMKDTMVSELCDINRNLMLSIDIIPVPTDEAVKEVETRLLGTETNITNWQRKQNQNNNFSAVVPYDLEQQRKESKEFLDDLTTRDQRMIFAVVTLVHTADTLEELNADTDTLIAIGLEKLCTFSILRYQQEDGLNTVLPYGLRRVKALRTLTTESTAVLMPFRAQEIQDPGGMYYGVNAVSKNLLICDRRRLVSPHAFYLGVSGSGKSVGMKSTILNIALNTDDDIIIIDSDREYGALVEALNGETIILSPGSPHRLNPLEMSDGYGDGENPIAMKSEVITTILEQQMGQGMLTASHKSIIDRCTTNIYRSFMRSHGEAPPPLLTDWRAEVMKQREPEARALALVSEILTEGSLNIFSQQSNVDMSNRIINIDLYEMGERLRPTSLVVTLEVIQNRVAANRRKGRFTWVFIDEVYLYFKYKYSAEILYRAWKRFRKFGAPLTAATQNVEECLRSDTARLMFANSEFLLLFNQAATDRQELAKLLHISDTQMGYITNAQPGHGLLRMGGALVPFANTIPHDSIIYKLISTTPGEK